MGFDEIPDGNSGGDLPEEIHYERFSPRVCEQLGRYVYRLVDPRNDETFYVGKGVNNRVFDHMEEAEDALFSGDGSPKVDRINAIHRAGQKVRTIIHRHGLRDDDETETVEAVLIEAYPNLTNLVAGHGTEKFGSRPTQNAISEYDLPPADLRRHRAVLLSLTKRWPRAEDDAPLSWSNIYDRARHGWALDVQRARRAEFVIAHARGIVRAVFEAEAWLPASDVAFAAFPTPERSPAWGFVGRPARWAARDAWVGRRVPDSHRARFGRRVGYANV